MDNADAIIDSVESIRRTDLAPQLWLKEVLESLQPCLDKSMGIFGCYIDASNLQSVQFAHSCTLDAPSGTIEAMAQLDRDPAQTATVKLKWLGQPATAVSALFGASFASYAPWAQYLKPRGMGDLLTLNAMSDTLCGLSISVPYRELLSHTPAQIALLERITAHLVVANRLRRQLEATTRPDLDPSVEAMLTPDGRVAHACGVATHAGARVALQQAVQAAERARGKLRHIDPVEALNLWQAMAGGRWAVVDHFDSDGRRYLVARVTDMVGDTLGRLTRRESQVAKLAALGHSNKMIAYELGIATSTVATYLARAVEKTGARSVRELVRTLLHTHLPTS